MGRNKIKIEKISNERNRQVTFYKRKRGLIKKAMELSLLCGVKVLLCIVDKRNKVNVFSSEKLQKFISDYLQDKIKPKNQLEPEDYPRLFKKYRSNLNLGNERNNGEIRHKFSTGKIFFYFGNSDKIQKKSKFPKVSESESKDEKDNIEIVNILENSMDSIYLPDSIKIVKDRNNTINDGFDSNDVLFFNNYIFNDDVTKEISIIPNNEPHIDENSVTCYSNISKKFKKENFLSNESNIENKTTIDKGIQELDSTNNISTSKINSRNSSKSKFKTEENKKKKSKFLCHKDVMIKDEVKSLNVFRNSNILKESNRTEAFVTNNSKTNLIQLKEETNLNIVNIESNQNKSISDTQDILSISFNTNKIETRKNMNANNNIIQKNNTEILFDNEDELIFRNKMEGKKLLSSLENKIISISSSQLDTKCIDNKIIPNPQPHEFLNSKHNRRNDFQSFSEYFKTVNDINNNIKNSSQTNQISSDSNNCRNINTINSFINNNSVGDSGNYSGNNNNFNFLNQRLLNFQFIQNINPIDRSKSPSLENFFDFNYRNYPLDDFLDYNDLKFLIDLERLCHMTK